MQRVSLFKVLFAFVVLSFMAIATQAQEQKDLSKLSIDRIYNSSDFRQDYFRGARWIEDGKAYTKFKLNREKGAVEVVRVETETEKESVLVSAEMLTPKGQEQPLRLRDYEWSHDKTKMLIYTNTARVWRYDTRGDYWILNLKTKELKQLGIGLPESSLMFAKFSPNDAQVAYVSKHNLYVEDLATADVKQLTFDGTDKIINGTFDWAYEEEFDCRDGFRWSYDGKYLAYWQVDATNIKNFLMINNTDSIYSYTIPVEYPKVGETPSACKIGVLPADGGKTRWLKIEGDPQQHYLPRMMWAEDRYEIFVQQLNRHQNHMKLWKCNALSADAVSIYEEKETAWIDAVNDWEWIDENHFTWTSEKGGWRQLYTLSDTGEEKKLTTAEYDVISIVTIDQKTKSCYFIASPDSPVQRYMYKCSLKKAGKVQRITPEAPKGTHSYDVAPGAKYAFHTFSNANTPSQQDLVGLPKHQVMRNLNDNTKLMETISKLDMKPVEFFQLTTEDDVTMEGYVIKPPNFDPSKKYPVLFHVYGEPFNQIAVDSWKRGNWFHRLVAQNGYVVVSLDNRGTPAPKGREWRKSIYRKLGVINAQDQAMAAKEVMKWDFIDADRIAVWGWSGGGSMTLNLMFKYPEIYKAGMSVAPVANQLTYDNIYQERYMGLPQENMEDFVIGSPLTYAKDLEGDLLLVHGTGDDNVHYQNAEMLINELVKYNKQFQMFAYPNRSHGIYEGEGTTIHLYTMLLDYLTNHVEAGGK